MKFNYILIFLFINVLFVTTPVFSAGTGLVSEKKIQEKIEAVENLKGLDDEARKKLLSLYSKNLGYLDSIKQNEQQSHSYGEARKQAPEEIKVLEKKLENLEKLEQEKSPEEISASIAKVSLLVLEQNLNSEAANLAAVKAKNDDLSQTINNEAESAPEIRKRLIEATQTLERLQDDKTLSSGSTSDELKQAEQWLSESHIAALRSEIKMLDLQLLSQSVRLKLLKLKKEQSDHNLKKIEIKVRFLEQQVDLKRSIEIQKTQEMTRAAEIKAQGKHPLIQSLAKSNTELSEQISSNTKKLSQLESSDEGIYKETRRLNEELSSTRKKLEIAGLNEILGQVLLEQKKALPDRKQYEKQLNIRQKQIAKSGLQRIQYQEELRKIKNTDEYLSLLMKDISPDTQVTIQDDLISQLKTRRKLLNKAISVDDNYLRTIAEINFAEAKLQKVSQNYTELLDEHLLWLRSGPLMNSDILKRIPEQVVFFLSSSRWIGFVNDFIRMINSSIYLATGLIFILVVLIKRSKLRALIINTGKKTRRISTDSLLHTMKGLFYSLLLAIPLPAIMLLSGWQLYRMPELSEFSHNMAQGMLVIALPLFSLQVIRFLCIPGGVAEVHFKWSEKLTDDLRKEMIRLMMTMLPSVFISVVLIVRDEYTVNDGLGRVALLVTILTITIFLYRLLKPGTGFLNLVVQDSPNSIFAKYQRVLFFLSLLITVSLMGLTIAGYVHTAGSLIRSLAFTLWFIFFLVILQQLAIRWLLLTRRRYALKIAYEKRKSAQEQRLLEEESAQKENDSETREHVIELDEPEIDMVSLSEDSYQLLNMVLFLCGISGLILIWIDLLPALGIFEQVELWHRISVVDGAEKLLPVTLGDLVLAILIAVVTISAGKRLPAIIEILLLQSKSISSGSRYTITTLINYSIVGIGFFSIFHILGADWARFQWLFAALSVGIGFGLQEIVANFISGIIILFERPIRVGDYVSVGDNEGVVSRIQIRATTILTRDRKELLVPNKEFITGQLLNWSLSDPTTRLIMPVGVAYGSDIPKAKELLLESALENEQVLAEPRPQVVFFNFGDNTLDLQLRCFIVDVDFRLRVISEINEKINEKFNAAGISIAFPQRDVHLDISQPIDVRLQEKPI